MKFQHACGMVVCLGFASLAGVLSGQGQPANDPPPLVDPSASLNLDPVRVQAIQARQGLKLLQDDLAVKLVDRNVTKQVRAQKLVQIADQAKLFYQTYANDDWAPEAKRVEILSLISAKHEGENTVGARLNQAVADLRADRGIPRAIRASGVAAFVFAEAMTSAGDSASLRTATRTAARTLVSEFPTEAPGYQGLLVVAQASEESEAVEILREVAASLGPVELKVIAQTQLDRLGLVGQSFWTVLDGNLAGQVPAEVRGKPMILYSWATWAPGSLALDQMITLRRFTAIGVCLDEDVTAAMKVHGVGVDEVTPIFNAQGRASPLVQALKLSQAGQIYLVDKSGVIRDVRGGEGLESKLTTWGIFSNIPKPADANETSLRP